MSESDSFRVWLDGVGRFPRLTSAEVVSAARTIQAWRNGQGSERAARRAINRMVTGNLGLAHHALRTFASGISPGSPMALDLLQEAAIGLHEAALRFDPERGWRFSTYASCRIKKRLQDWIRCKESPIRRPPDCVQVAASAARIRQRWAQEGKGTPTIDDLAAEIGRSPRSVQSYLELWARSNCASLDAPVRDGGTMHDLVSVPEEDPDQGSSIDEARRILAWARLTDEEREVLQRTVLGPESCSEAARACGLQVGRVRYLRARALRKCREAAGRIPDKCATLIRTTTAAARS